MSGWFGMIRDLADDYEQVHGPGTAISDTALGLLGMVTCMGAFVLLLVAGGAL